MTPAFAEEEGARLAFVHVDVDALWAVRRCYGDLEAAPSADDPIHTEGVPALRDLFDEAGVEASWFVVGRDAAVPAIAHRLAGLAASGHAVENHSWSHDLGLSDLPDAGLAAEVDRAHEAVAAATGCAPRGFRAPGYDASARLLRLLADRGYAYDSSVLPTWAGPVLRWGDARLRGGWPKRRQYGSAWGGAWAPRAPYRVSADGRASPHRRGDSGAADDRPAIWELPVAVSPVLRLPIHASFAMLRGIGPLRRALRALEAFPHPIVYLFHGIDATDVGGARHPVPSGRGRSLFGRSRADKLAALRAILAELTSHRRVVSTAAWLAAQEATGKSSLDKGPDAARPGDPA